MASEFLEILSEGALQELEKVEALVKSLATDIKNINSFKASNTPSGADNTIKKLNAQYTEQANALKLVKLELENLYNTQKKEEQLKQQILSTEIKETNAKKAKLTLTEAETKASEKKIKKLSEEEQAYNKVLAKQQQVVKNIRDLVVETGKESEAVKKLQTQLDALNTELLQAEQASKKYAMGASSLATPVLLYAEAQKKATQATKEANAEKAKSNAMISKQMTGQMVESVNTIGKPTESLKRMNDYYRELEKTTAAEAKSVTANQNLNRAYVQLTANREKAKQKLQDYIAEETRSNSEIRKAQKEFDVLNKKVAAADKAVGRFSDANRKINGLASSVGNLMTAFGIGTGIYLAIDISKSIYNTTKELQSLDLALKMVSGTNQEYAENQNFVREVSEKWGLEVKSLTQQYTQFYTASKGLLSQEAIKTTFEGIAKAGSVMGLSLEKQKDAFYAIDQMMSKGNVTAEELKKQLGNAMPGAIKAAAMAYQELHPQIKTIQEAEKGLYEAMKKGALDSATYVPLIVKNLNKIYGIEMLNKVDTLQANQNRLQNSWTNLVKSMNESENGGLTKFITGSISLVQKLIDKITEANTSWANLQKKSQVEARARGAESFKKDISNLVKEGKTAEDVKKIISINREVLGQDYIDISSKIEAEQANLKRIYKENEKYRTVQGSDNISNYESQTSERRLIELKKQLGFVEGKLKAGAMELQKINAPIAKAKPTAVVKTQKEINQELKLEKDQAKEREQILKEQYEAELSNLEKEKFIIEQKMLLKENNYSDNLRLAIDLGAKEQEIALAVYNEELRLAGDSKEKKIITDNKYYEQKIKIAQNSIDKIQKLEYKPQYKDNSKVADEETYGSGVFELDKENTDYLVDEWNKHSDKKKKDQEDEIERLKAMRNVLNDIFSEFGQATGFEKTMEVFNQVGRNGKTFWENLTGGEEGKAEVEEYLLAGLTVFQDVGNKIWENSQQNFQKERSLLEERYNDQLEFAGDSEEAKAKLLEDYNKRKKEIDLREAKAKKKQALFNIAIDTAQAIMAVIAKGGKLWEGLAVGALGAIQYGIIASKDIPEFWQGGIHDGGMLKMNDDPYGIKGGNFKEVALTPDGNIFKPQGKDVYADLPKGTEIFKDYKSFDQFMFNKDLNNIMMDNGIGNAPKIVVNNTGVTKAELRDVMFETLGSMAIESTNIDVNGFTKVISKGHSKTIEHTARITGMGLKIGR